MKTEDKANKNSVGTIDDLIQGMKDGIPIGLGYFAVAFTFGMAAARDGIGALWSAFISLTCVTSAGQFAGLTVIAAGGSLIELALTQLIINLRYLLMSFSISAKLTETGAGTAPRLLVAHGVTDEIFAISQTRPYLKPAYTWGAMCVAIPGWVSGAFFGGILGDVLPGALLSAFGIAIYGMFLAIILPPASEDRAVLIVVLAAMAFRAVLTWVPVLKLISPGFAIIIVTVVVAAVAAWLSPVKEEGGES